MGQRVDNSIPAEIGGYAIVASLRAGETFLAEAPGGRRLVLKMLPAECLLEGQLHPSVRDRLSRVRELAEKNVANLHGVERDGPYTYLVWDFVPGESLADLDLAWRQALLIARELVLTIESLHAAGIVHGAIKPGNIIVDLPDGRVRVTHVSPLLYSDPARDADAVTALVQQLLADQREKEPPLSAALSSTQAQRPTLRQLSALLASARDPGEPASRFRRENRAGAEGGVRRRALIGALLVALVALAASVGAWWYIRRATDPYRAGGTPSRIFQPPPATRPGA